MADILLDNISMVWRIYAEGNITVGFCYGSVSDVIMSAMASQITDVSIVCNSGADRRKHQSSASLAFVREFTGDRWIPALKGSNAENVSTHLTSLTLQTVTLGGIPPTQHQTWPWALSEEFKALANDCWMGLWCFVVWRYWETSIKKYK